MAALYADEDFPDPVAELLALLGHDVLTVQNDGRSRQGIDDPDVLQRAIVLNRCILTRNRDDFRILHRQDPNHTGIIIATRDDDVDALATRIDAKIAQ